MKVFLAMPYSQLCDKNYEVKLEYKCFFIKEYRFLKYSFFLVANIL